MLPQLCRICSPPTPSRASNTPFYLPSLATTIFFLCIKVKEEVVGLSLNQDSIKNTWEGVTNTITADKFATAFRRWYEHCKKCVRLGGKYVEKSKK